MKIINFGSINVDCVYRVAHIVKPGETIPSVSLSINPGGKGANQSVAFAKAGAPIYHAGRVGNDTKWMIDRLNAYSVDTRFIKIADDVNGGQAMIQVDDNGQNSIIIFGGANQAIPETDLAEVLAFAAPGDWLVLQNEINLTPQLIQAGHEAGLNICFNPAPMTAAVMAMPLQFVNLFIVNEIEGAELAQLPVDSAPDAIIERLSKAYPAAAICLTLGEHGSIYHSQATGTIVQAPYRVKAVDTTAAGDTFTGFFLAELARGTAAKDALDIASRASAIAVSRPGAMDSIPERQEVLSAFQS